MGLYTVKLYEHKPNSIEELGRQTVEADGPVSAILKTKFESIIPKNSIIIVKVEGHKLGLPPTIMENDSAPTWGYYEDSHAYNR